VEILVLHPGALGDLILALPAVEMLRSRFPQAGTTLAGNVDFATVLAPGYADRVVSLGTLPLHPLYHSGEPSKELASFWSRYDRVVSWTGFGDLHFSANLAAVCRQILVAPWKPGPGETRHVSEIFVESLFPWLRRVDAIPLPHVQALPESRCRAAAWFAELGWGAGHPVIALHPGAGRPDKRWPAQRFAVVASGLLRRSASVRILLIEGPAEPGLGRWILRELPPGRAALAHNLDLGLLSGLLARCAAFSGNDSGIAHLAAALGIPSLVLFGPTNPDQWRPRGKAVHIVREPAGCIESIAADLVLDRLSVVCGL
jgi:ADP-heptose:LPS heptosyltransferase